MAGSTVGGGTGVAQTRPPAQLPIQFRGVGPVLAAARPLADPGCVRSAGDNGLWQVLVTVSAVAAAHRAAPGQAGEMTGVTGPAYCWCTIGSRAVPGSRGGRS